MPLFVALLETRLDTTKLIYCINPLMFFVYFTCIGSLNNHFPPSPNFPTNKQLIT
jgi:hypothetical protein